MKAFKSGKQRRVELLAARERRQQRRSRQARASVTPAVKRFPATCVPVDPARLQPYNSYGVPDFVWRGHYVDLAFRCRDCGAEAVWTAERQRWWYEVAGGDVYATACRCAACRALGFGETAQGRGPAAFAAGMVEQASGTGRLSKENGHEREMASGR